MITACEARNRAKLSSNAVDQFLIVLNEKIVAYADAGKFEYIYTGDLGYDPTSHGEIHLLEHARFKPPKFWLLVKERLEAAPLSYKVEIYKPRPTVYNGLGSTGDEEPMIHYGLKITW